MSSSETFYWHDYETFGADPSRDRPCQFAGLRTDFELNIIGEPLVIFASPADDMLPHPQACLITGITPQQALAEGVPECEFMASIHEELARPGTCGVGYNSLRFDDEITRYTLYRNFFDPYAREWQNGNSRWDIIDMVRATCALRPEGIQWPQRDDGFPSFRLEDLTTANGIAHTAAHDALSDVHATIAVAGLIKQRQPKLFDYVLHNRGKRAVLAQLDLEHLKPVLHVSGMFGAARHNIALIVPLAMHPTNKNEVICYDLAADPACISELDAQELAQRLFRRKEEQVDGEERPGIKSVHINKCPILITPKMADPATAERLGIDGAVCRAHLAHLREYRARDPRSFVAKLHAVFEQRTFVETTDPDRMLYGGGFFTDGDKRIMDQIRSTAPAELGVQSFSFEDQRLPEMLFRYRARNYPDTLSPDERAQWEEYRFARLTEPDAGASIVLDQYHDLIEQLLQDDSLAQDKAALLQQLQAYGDSLLV